MSEDEIIDRITSKIMDGDLIDGDYVRLSRSSCESLVREAIEEFSIICAEIDPIAQRRANLIAFANDRVRNAS